MVEWKELSLSGRELLVSSDGEIKYKDAKGIYQSKKQGVTNLGYTTISISVDGKSKNYKVHRVVAMAFIPNPENKPQINHKNGIRNDNRASNLEWTTSKENARHGAILKKLKEKSVSGEASITAMTACVIYQDEKIIEAKRKEPRSILLKENKERKIEESRKFNLLEDEREIPGFGGAYTITEGGQIYNIRIKAINTKNGWQRVVKRRPVQPCRGWGNRPTVTLYADGKKAWSGAIAVLVRQIFGNSQ